MAGSFPEAAAAAIPVQTPAPTLLVFTTAFAAAIGAFLASSASAAFAVSSVPSKAGAVVCWPAAHWSAYRQATAASAAADFAATFAKILAQPPLPPCSEDKRFRAPLADPVCEKTTYILRITHFQ